MTDHLEDLINEENWRAAIIETALYPEPYQEDEDYDQIGSIFQDQLPAF